MLQPLLSNLALNPTSIYLYKEFLNNSEIENLISYLDSLPLVVATTQSNNPLDNGRRSKVKWLEPNDLNLKWLQNKIYKGVKEANSKNWNFNLIGILEKIQYTEYHSQDLGHFEWHLDLGSQFTQTRKISLTIQLSDPSEYKGGNLEIFTGGDYNDPNTKILAPKEKGTAVFFPSYIVHRVTPVTKGIRKSLVIWIGGSPFN